MAKMQTFGQGLYIDASDLKRAMRVMKTIPTGTEESIRQAIIKTHAFIKKEVVAQITKEYHIDAGSLKSQGHRARFVMETKSPKKTGNLTEGGVAVASHRLPIMRFYVNPRTPPNQRGIPVGARPPVDWSTIKGIVHSGEPNTFVARMPSGHIGLYRRKPGATHKRMGPGRRSTLPIEEMFMISPSEMLSGKRIRTKLQKRIKEHFHSHLSHEIMEMLDKVVTLGETVIEKGAGAAESIGETMVELL
jgi:hypothetical protein